MSACAGADDKNWKSVLNFCFQYLNKMSERQDKFLRCVRIESKNTFAVIPHLLKDIDDIKTEEWEKIAEKPHLITKKFDEDFLQLDYTKLLQKFNYLSKLNLRVVGGEP